MCSATALSTASSLQGMEDRLRKRLKEVKRNSLGSEYVAFHAGRDEVVALAGSDLVVEVGLTHESKQKYLSYRAWLQKMTVLVTSNLCCPVQEYERKQDHDCTQCERLDHNFLISSIW